MRVALLGDIPGAHAFITRRTQAAVTTDIGQAHVLVVATRTGDLSVALARQAQSFMRDGRPVLVLTPAGVADGRHCHWRTAPAGGPTRVEPWSGAAATLARCGLLLALGAERGRGWPVSVTAVALRDSVREPVKTSTPGDRAYLSEAELGRRMNPDGKVILTAREKSAAARDRNDGSPRRKGGRDAGEWIADYVRDHGDGPTWRELWDAMGWDSSGVGFRSPEAHTMMRGFKRKGWVTYGSQQERSLRPGPALAVRRPVAKGA